MYIVDEVHMLTDSAFNALLKTLEEPPAHAVFILATTEAHKIPITILSRCQRYDFKRITIDTIAARIKEPTEIEQVTIEDKAIRYIAKTADGSMRDALSLLDQCIAFHFGKELTYDMVLDVLGAVDTEVFSRLLRVVLDGNVPGAIGILEEMVMQGRELTQFVADFTWYLRNLLLIKTADGAQDVIDVSSENMTRLKEEAQMAEHDVIMRYIRVLSELSGQIRYAAQKRILIEIALIKLCKPEMETDTQSLTDRIRQLEKKVERGVSSVNPEMLQQLQQGMAAMGGGISAASGMGEAVSISRAPLPKAIPEDIQKVVDKWSVAVAEAPNPMKTYLKGAYPSLGTEGQLLVVVPDGLPYDYLRQAGHKEELQKILSAYAGKEIEIMVQTTENGRNPEDAFPDLTRLVSETINMEIEEIDEEEDAF